VVFSITVSLEAYLRVILVVVLRSRCYADAIRIEERLLSSLYTLTRNFWTTDSENQTRSVTRSYFTSLQNNIPDVKVSTVSKTGLSSRLAEMVLLIGWYPIRFCISRPD
jgi:hypothetical protein